MSRGTPIRIAEVTRRQAASRTLGRLFDGPVILVRDKGTLEMLLTAVGEAAGTDVRRSRRAGHAPLFHGVPIRYLPTLEDGEVLLVKPERPPGEAAREAEALMVRLTGCVPGDAGGPA